MKDLVILFLMYVLMGVLMVGGLYLMCAILAYMESHFWAVVVMGIVMLVTIYKTLKEFEKN